MKDRRFVFSGSIVVNVHKKAFYDFFREKKIEKLYINIGKSIEYFVSEMINDNKLSINDINDFLFDKLFFGYHKDIFIQKMVTRGTIIDDEKKLLEILNQNYKITSLNHNEIATTLFGKSEEIKEKLAAIKVYKDNNKINKVRFLFAKEIKINHENNRQSDSISYVPIEINLDKGLIIVKGYDKTKVKDIEFKYSSLMNYFNDKLKQLMGINVNSYGIEHGEIMYSICKTLVDNVFKKMMGNKMNNYNEDIINLSNILIDKIKIIDIEEKKKFNNIFDIKCNINNMIENMLISDYCYSFDLNNDTLCFDGIITYIKFNDETNVNAIIKGENYRKPVFDSDAFMGLRNSIENKKQIKELVVIWNKDNNELRVKYNAGDSNFLKMHMYINYNEGDFDYALKKYIEFESKNLDCISEMDRDTAYILL